MTTIIGFIMTIYISIKTKSIHKKLLEYKTIVEFNSRREKYINSLQSYQTSIINQEIDITKLSKIILNDINIIYESYKELLSLPQMIIFLKIKKELEKSKGINENKISNLLSKVIAFMSKSKEE